MAIATVHSVGIAEMIQQAQLPSVALAAGIDAATWGSTTSPRVIPGNKGGFLFDLHRGRLPMIEIWQMSTDPENTSAEQAFVSTRWGIRVHVGGIDMAAADTMAHLIMLSVLVVIRRNVRQRWGAEHVGMFVPGVLAHKLEADITVLNTMSRSTFSVTPGYLQLETGGYILLETGGKIQLEDAALPTVISD